MICLLDAKIILNLNIFETMENFKEIWPAVVWRETCTNSQIVVFAGINQKKPGLNYGTKYLMSGKES